MYDGILVSLWIDMRVAVGSYAVINRGRNNVGQTRINSVAYFYPLSAQYESGATVLPWSAMGQRRSCTNKLILSHLFERVCWD